MSFIDHIFYKLKNHLFITFNTKNTARLFFVILAITLSGKVSANAASWAGFGGANVSDQEVLEVPSGAQVWAGFANTNGTLYPISLSSGGVITFTASVSGSASVRFRLERLPYPDVDPAFNTDSVIVTGTTEATYSIEIPEQGANIYRSLILYIDNLDTPVTLKNVQVTPYGNDQNGCDFSPQSSGVMQIEAECYSLADGIEGEAEVLEAFAGCDAVGDGNSGLVPELVPGEKDARGALFDERDETLCVAVAEPFVLEADLVQRLT